MLVVAILSVTVTCQGHLCPLHQECRHGLEAQGSQH